MSLQNAKVSLAAIFFLLTTERGGQLNGVESLFVFSSTQHAPAARYRRYNSLPGPPFEVPSSSPEWIMVKKETLQKPVVPASCAISKELAAVDVEETRSAPGSSSVVCGASLSHRLSFPCSSLLAMRPYPLAVQAATARSVRCCRPCSVFCVPGCCRCSYLKLLRFATAMGGSPSSLRRLPPLFSSLLPVSQVGGVGLHTEAVGGGQSGL